MKEKKTKTISFPMSVLKPVQEFLMREQSRLNAQKKRLDREDPFSDPSHADDNADIGTDAADQTGHERVQLIKGEVDKMLINVRKSLARIKLGKYGICANCKKMIDTDRLAINPTAEFCMDCARLMEKKNR